MMKSNSFMMDGLETVTFRIYHADDQYAVNNTALAIIVSESLRVAFNLATHEDPRNG